VEVWGSDVARFAAATGVSVKTALCDFTLGDARVQVDTMLKNPLVNYMTDAGFLQYFVDFYKQMVKPRHLAARDKLFDIDTYRMAVGERVSAYYARFSRIALDAAPINEADLVYHFKLGLAGTALEELCQTPEGPSAEFASVHELYIHATKMEAKLRVKRPRLAVAITDAPNPTLAATQVQRPATQNNAPAQPAFTRGHGPGPMQRHGGGYHHRRHGGRPRGPFNGPRQGHGFGRRHGGGPPRHGGFQPQQYNQAPHRQPRTAGRDDHAQARYQFARKSGACTICLQLGHFAATCPNRRDDMGMA
jgi:hypothetical protein